MHTSTPHVTAELRADTSFAYIDDSKHVAGEPDMDCILLNLSKAPFDNLKVRQAAAMAVSSAAYSTVITNGVEPVPPTGPSSRARRTSPPPAIPSPTLPRRPAGQRGRAARRASR